MGQRHCRAEHDHGHRAHVPALAAAIGSRTKTAVFSTSAGMLPAAPVVLTVER